MITDGQILKAKDTLANEFIRVASGVATTEVEQQDQDAAAVGQHMPGTSNQRGMHGTAAAIRVLADSSVDEASTYTKRLVHYVENRRQIESAFEPPHIDERVLNENDRNVIKISEVLYSLSIVPTGTASTEQLKQRLARTLLDGHSLGSGWGYYIDANADDTALLPSAFAVFALSANGYDVKQDIEYLRRQMTQGDGATQTDISVQVFVLYVLCYMKNAPDPDKALSKAFRQLWERLAPLLVQDLESNIEYVDPRSEYVRASYVRVPWQLYLIACSAKMSAYRRFASARAQRRLQSILGSITTSGGLIYPHSGTDLSTRTNAILYEVLDRLRTELNVRRLPLKPFELYDRTREFLSSKPATYLVRLIVLMLMGFAVRNWLRSPGHELGALAPEFISSFLLIILTARKDV